MNNSIEADLTSSDIPSVGNRIGGSGSGSSILVGQSAIASPMSINQSESTNEREDGAEDSRS